jgi:sec-independent protein translocase protein TatA
MRRITMGVPSGMELFIIVAVLVLLFGGKKIPELAKGLGQGIKNFKSAVKEDEPTVAKTNDEKIEENKTENTTTTASTNETVNSTTTNNETKNA